MGEGKRVQAFTASFPAPSTGPTQGGSYRRHDDCYFWCCVITNEHQVWGIHLIQPVAGWAPIPPQVRPKGAAAVCINL